MMPFTFDETHATTTVAQATGINPINDRVAKPPLLPTSVPSLIDVHKSALPLYEHQNNSQKTLFYLAYGSNLSAAKFRDVRNIRPLSQINVVAPSLRLTFDLPGLPYVEPCFANSAWREDAASPGKEQRFGYHKDEWHKGLVGVVYEVTKDDFAHIIETEGAGMRYRITPVQCFPLEKGASTVPSVPATDPFTALVLLAPTTQAHRRSRVSDDYPVRKDLSYAQPSARYLDLITTGAQELDLPREYRNYLARIRAYQTTSRWQQVGGAVFVALWGPLMMLLLWLGPVVMNKKKVKSPAWYIIFAGRFFSLVWLSYDWVFRPIFGDGERTQPSD